MRSKRARTGAPPEKTPIAEVQAPTAPAPAALDGLFAPLASIMGAFETAAEKLVSTTEAAARNGKAGKQRNARASDNKWYRIIDGGNEKCPVKCDLAHAKSAACHMDHSDK